MVNNVEVIQAQEAVALAAEQHITALYGFSVSKALLARSLGSAEQAVQKYPRRVDSMKKRLPLIAAGAVLVVVVISLWIWSTSGRESTDDAQVEAHVTPIAARVGGTVARVPVNDNQQVEAGAALVELDLRDYQIALDRARAELADAQAAAVAADANVPITSTTTAGNVATARGGWKRRRPISRKPRTVWKPPRPA